MDAPVRILLLVLTLFSASSIASESPEEPALACHTGPIERQLNGSAWNVYSCADNRSVVVVPVAATTVNFGYFFVTPAEQIVAVVGEGWGEDSTFQPVFQELQKITVPELAAIVEATRAVSGKQSATP